MWMIVILLLCGAGREDVRIEWGPKTGYRTQKTCQENIKTRGGTIGPLIDAGRVRVTCERIGKAAP
jgi:hypothetical protein